MLLKIAIAIGVIAAALAGGYFAYTQGLWRFNYPDAAQYPVQGLDVSHHQGDIDWAAVPKDFKFVYIKATEGGDHTDRKFLENWNAARAAGLRTGAYHFFTLCRPGADQVKNFIALAPKESDALAPVIDLEFVGNCRERPSREEFLKQLQDYAGGIEKHFGVKPLLYTTYHFYDEYLGDTEFADYPLWVRDVFHAPDADIFPSWQIWQYADNARIPGINGPVDLNAASAHNQFLD